MPAVSRAVLALALIGVGCSKPTTEATTPAPTQGQHFCCKAVELQFWLGQDCKPVDKDVAASCSEVLYCAGDWGRSADTGKQWDRPGVITKCRGPE